MNTGYHFTNANLYTFAPVSMWVTLTSYIPFVGQMKHQQEHDAMVHRHEYTRWQGPHSDDPKT